MLWFLTTKAWRVVSGAPEKWNPPCQSGWRPDAVFTGTVTEITDPERPIAPPVPPTFPLPFLQRKVPIKITEVLVGLDANQQEVVIETGLGGGDCGYGFRRGMDYIVYASKKPGGG